MDLAPPPLALPMQNRTYLVLKYLPPVALRLPNRRRLCKMQVHGWRFLLMDMYSHLMAPANLLSMNFVVLA